MEEPADSSTRRELAQKYQVHSTGAVNSWDFKSLIWVELCPFPPRLGGKGVRDPLHMYKLGVPKACHYIT